VSGKFALPELKPQFLRHPTYSLVINDYVTVNNTFCVASVGYNAMMEQLHVETMFWYGFSYLS
jgi:hypothetical protein